MAREPSSFTASGDGQIGAVVDSEANVRSPAVESQRAAKVARAGRNRFGSPFTVSTAAATMVLLVSCWLSSGTMAPYGATLAPEVVRVQPPCEYLTNIDHVHFQATFWMLEGKPKASWDFSVVLRRILYPILAFPLMKALGFEIGGFVTNLVLTLSVCLIFVFFVRRAIGEQGAIAAAWLLATYPGIAYWVGLPYSYVFIVPGSLLLAILLWKLANTSAQLSTFFIALAMGFLFWGYDLFPFFGTAGLLILIRKRHFKRLPTALIGMAIPIAVLLLLLDKVFHVPLRNSNTEVYLMILGSFAQRIDYPQWWKLLAEAPEVLLQVFLFSNFLFLPLLFLLLSGFNLIVGRSVSIQTPEAEILLAVLVVFLINNLAPPYPGWQMRGVWFARLYQPMFAAMILFACRTVQNWWHSTEASAGLATIPALLVALTVAANAGVVWGPALGFSTASELYWRFYRHSPSSSLQRNLDLHGRRPLGVCKVMPAGN